MIIHTDQPITVIPEDFKLPTEFQSLKVAVYARVSTIFQWVGFFCLDWCFDSYMGLVEKRKSGYFPKIVSGAGFLQVGILAFFGSALLIFANQSNDFGGF